jgi:hypothetical protein
VVCLAPRARGDSVRPRRLSGVGARPLNFTVRGRIRDFFFKSRSPIKELGPKTLPSTLLLERARAVTEPECSWRARVCVPSLLRLCSSSWVSDRLPAPLGAEDSARTAALFTSRGRCGLRSTVAAGTVRWWLRPLTIVGGVREALAVWRLGL